MRKQPTAEQKAKSEARKAAMRALSKTIAAMDETARLALAASSPVVTVEGRYLSPFNTCMITMQHPSATVVGGFQQWRAHGRQVRKGEHGSALWFPCRGTKADETPTEEATDANGARPRFMLGTVFDVSQTDETEVQA